MIANQHPNLAIFDMDSTICESFVEVAFFVDYSQTEKEEAFHVDAHDWPNEVRKAIRRANCTLPQVETILRKLTLVEGIQAVLQHLSANHDIIVVSGANDFLCRRYMQLMDCDHYVKHYFSNTLTYDHAAERFSYHEPQFVDCGVPMCGKGICKRTTLQQYLAGKEYQKMRYFGDGTNDFCGMSALRKGDQAFVRRYYSLYNFLKAEPHLQKEHLQCEVISWNNGIDVIKHL